MHRLVVYLNTGVVRTDNKDDMVQLYKLAMYTGLKSLCDTIMQHIVDNIKERQRLYI